MNWNRELAQFFMAFLVVLSLILLILKKKNLGRYSNYVIAAVAVGAFVELFNIGRNLLFVKSNSVLIYVIGTNLFVFLFYFLYFHQLLQSKTYRKISEIIIILFLLNYFSFALFDDDFFVKFPFISYFVQVVLLAATIFLHMSETFNSDRILALSKYFPFWVSLSLLIIYLGVLPLLVVSYTAANFMNLNIFFVILFLVNLLGYSLLIMGILRARPEN